MMTRNLFDLDNTITQLPDAPRELRKPYPKAEAFILAVVSPLQWHHLYANLKAFLSRFLVLARQPKGFAPLVVDYCLLLQSIWIGKQFGPDFVYPMLSITKRQSGRLAGLILEHCRAMREYEHRVAASFPRGIHDPPCVAVLDLDEVSQDVVENGYSTRVYLYGLMSMLAFFEIMLTCTVHVFYLPTSGWAVWFGWVYCPIMILGFCSYPVIRGDGTLTLAQRSDTSAPRCAVFLDQDFTAILFSKQSIIESIAEGGFNLSHSNPVWSPSPFDEEAERDSCLEILEALCEGFFLAVVASCWLLLFRPSMTTGGIVLMGLVFVTMIVLQGPPPEHSGTLHIVFSFCCRGFPPFGLLVAYGHAMIQSPLFEIFDLQRDVHFLSVVLLILFFLGYDAARNYPIRSAKFLDALGRPPVRKWQFDTLAAAATFQCLVLCRGITRPVKSIDVSAFLDVLVPDQRDIWRAWKDRVADRVVHETDICFAPTIPTFWDDWRQRQLKDLLDQAQLAHDAYMRFYDGRGPDH